MKYEDFIVSNLGRASVVSPLKNSQREDSPVYKFVNDRDRVLYDVSADHFIKCRENGSEPVSFEKAGPKEYQ